MYFNTQTILSAALLMAGVSAQPTDSGHTHVERAVFRDEFTTFDEKVWSCEYTCPVIEGEKARFRLRSGIAPNNEGSWSKARYTPKRFTSGRFTVSFSLTAKPDEPVWWGVALWDDTGDNGFNEINFGYTTDGKNLGKTELLFESAKDGNDISIPVDTGVDLYDETWHEATLEYDADRVAFYFDGKLLKEVTDKQYIPTAPMDFLLGPRLVRGEPMAKGFTQSIDWVEIEG
ncbi:hypothetical protein ACHAPJ_008455 [Fusarium lateritium]